VTHVRTLMARLARLSMFCFAFVLNAAAQTPQDYTDVLLELTELTGNKQYKEAIDGYRRLQAQAGTPGWLKAASEYEVAELYGALGQTDSAVASFGRAVDTGFDDCLTPRASERFAPILKNPKAAQAYSRIRIPEGDLRELTWLKSEVEHAEHDARMMITDNMNRVDHHPTEIPQAQLPTRPTTSAAVLYWRQQLLLMQRAQRDFVKKSDDERISHSASMGVIAGGPTPAATLESTRRAQAAAASRRADIRKRAFVAAAASSGRMRSCDE